MLTTVVTLCAIFGSLATFAVMSSKERLGESRYLTWLPRTLGLAAVGWFGGLFNPFLGSTLAFVAGGVVGFAVGAVCSNHLMRSVGMFNKGEEVYVPMSWANEGRGYDDRDEPPQMV